MTSFYTEKATGSSNLKPCHLMGSMPMSRMGPLSFRLLSCDDGGRTLTHGTCLNPRLTLSLATQDSNNGHGTTTVRPFLLHCVSVFVLFLKLFCCSTLCLVSVLPIRSEEGPRPKAYRWFTVCNVLHQSPHLSHLSILLDGST